MRITLQIRDLIQSTLCNGYTDIRSHTLTDVTGSDKAIITHKKVLSKNRIGVGREHQVKIVVSVDVIEQNNGRMDAFEIIIHFIKVVIQIGLL